MAIVWQGRAAMAIVWQGRAAMAISWLGRAIWPTEGMEDGGRNVELEPKV